MLPLVSPSGTLFLYSLTSATIDPTHYTVVQDIVRSKDTAQSSPPATENILLSVVYQFNNPFATPPLSPDSAVYGETETTSYSVESSVSVYIHNDNEDSGSCPYGSLN